MGGAANLFQVSIDSGKPEFPDESGIWPAFDRLSYAPICKVLSFTNF
jgi:hypothetical protein